MPPVFDTNSSSYREWDGRFSNVSQDTVYLYTNKQYSSLLVYYQTWIDGSEIYSLKQLSENCKGSNLIYQFCSVLGGLQPNTRYEMRVSDV